MLFVLGPLSSLALHLRGLVPASTFPRLHVSRFPVPAGDRVRKEAAGCLPAWSLL